jgi:hypothetical protein
VNAAEVARASIRAATTAVNEGSSRDIRSWQLGLCNSLQHYTLPLLRELRAKSGGWKIWLRLALGITIGALETFVREACRSDA